MFRVTTTGNAPVEGLGERPRAGLGHEEVASRQDLRDAVGEPEPHQPSPRPRLERGASLSKENRVLAADRDHPQRRVGLQQPLCEGSHLGWNPCPRRGGSPRNHPAAGPAPRARYRAPPAPPRGRSSGAGPCPNAGDPLRGIPVASACPRASSVPTTTRSSPGSIQKRGGKSARSVRTTTSGAPGDRLAEASRMTPLKLGNTETTAAGRGCPEPPGQRPHEGGAARADARVHQPEERHHERARVPPQDEVVGVLERHPRRPLQDVEREERLLEALDPEAEGGARLLGRGRESARGRAVPPAGVDREQQDLGDALIQDLPP